MKCNLIIRLCFILVTSQLLFACMTVKELGESPRPALKLQLNQYETSHFKQVEATFFTHQTKELVFRVLSSTEQTPQWVQRVQSLEVLAVYNHQHYLLRTIINSPWPFKNRELITCVKTEFSENTTQINITSCSERVPKNEAYLRLERVESHWTIRKKTDSLVEINYKTWIDPAGNVPAFIFNRELLKNTEFDLKQLKALIDNASLDDYAY